jgi:hypothetical protein
MTNAEKQALRQIGHHLNKIHSTGVILKNAKGAGRIFELYLMMRIALGLKQKGWIVKLCSSNGQHLTNAMGLPFVQRGGAPSGIVQASNTGGPSYIEVKRQANSSTYEIWNGIQFQGRSGALHELDLAVVPNTMANALRRGKGISFPFGRPPVSIECKDVGARGNPDEMRALVTRMYDLTVLSGSQKYLQVASSRLASLNLQNTYLSTNQNALCVLARRGGISDIAELMANYYKISTHTNVVASHRARRKLIDEIVNWMDMNL